MDAEESEIHLGEVEEADASGGGLRLGLENAQR